VARDYGFTKASLDGRRVGAQAQADLGGLALTQAIGVPAGASSTVGYRLQRPGAASRLDDGRLRYQLLLRPQATVRPDRARVVVLAPAGWRFAAWPADGRVAGASASWSGSLDRERALVFDLAPA
jgi:hypothetical protein